MTVSGRSRRLAIFGLISFGLAGVGMHLSIHPPVNDGVLAAGNLKPLISAVLSILVVPALFSTGRHSHIAQALNLVTVLAGVVAMTDFMIEKAGGQYSLGWLLVGGTLADSLILVGKGLLGQVLFEVDYSRAAAGGWKERQGRPPWWRLMHLPAKDAHASIRLAAAGGIALVGLGGALLHIRTHPAYDPEYGVAWTYSTPMVLAVLSVLIAPVLFMLGKPAWAQLFNGMAAIVGIVTMTHYWIEMGRPTYAVSLFLVGRWAMGQLVLESELDRAARRGWDDASKRPKWWRFQRIAWWAIHLAAIGAIYASAVVILG